jgi:hypothetical protein
MRLRWLLCYTLAVPYLTNTAVQPGKVNLVSSNSRGVLPPGKPNRLKCIEFSA